MIGGDLNSDVIPRGGTWVFRGAHKLVIKIKKYP